MNNYKHLVKDLNSSSMLYEYLNNAPAQYRSSWQVLLLYKLSSGNFVTVESNSDSALIICLYDNTGDYITSDNIELDETDRRVADNIINDISRIEDFEESIEEIEQIFTIETVEQIRKLYLIHNLTCAE